jgi:hypothetical protein
VEKEQQYTSNLEEKREFHRINIAFMETAAASGRSACSFDLHLGRCSSL